MPTLFSIKHTLSAFMHLASLVFLAASSIAKEAKPLDLILVAGQANAVGFDAAPKDLPADAGDAEILFWWRCGDPGSDENDSTSGGAWTHLQAQPRGNPQQTEKPFVTRQYGNFAQAEGGFGPEMSLARGLRSKGGARRAVVKVAFSGTGLRADWNPANGACFRALVAEAQAAIAAAWAQGFAMRVRALAWVQGESDANEKDAPDYAKNLASMLAAVRRELHAPEMIALLGVNERYGRGKNPFIAGIVAAQAHVAANDARNVRVSTAAPELVNDAHFSAVGTLAVGAAFADALLKVEVAKSREPYNTEPAKTAPLAAEEAARQWKWPDGFRTSVFAAEPDVRQPIAIAMDGRGRLWVAESYTYAEHKTGFAADLRDRIVIFEDTDGDGRHDQRTVFCDGLERLTSIEIGFGGVWVLALPQLLFFPDKNGDDCPDGPPAVRLDGFEWQRSHHTIANGMRWGPDGWLYGRHGIQAVSLLGQPGTPDSERMKMNVGIWRYHPQRHTVEVVCEGTTNPWGMDWNEVGEAFFINTVIGHLWHAIPGAHFRRMYGSDLNPHIYAVIEQHADHVHWADGEEWNDWQKLGTTDATSAAGGGHAHTGLMFYAGDNWPDAWRGKLLTINFNGRRVNVEDVVRGGSGYVGKRLPDTGFAADAWFRGIDLLYGPDGGVFIADWSDAGECHENDGVHRTSGRIFKITHGLPPRPAIADIGKLEQTALLPLQEMKNEFFARHARRRLQEVAASGADLRAVRETLRGKFGGVSGTVAKLRALWSLHAVGADDPDFLRAQLGHADEAVRTWAIRLLLDDRDAVTPATTAALTALAQKESAASVRLALASALQRVPLAARSALAAPLLRHAEDATDHNLPQMLWYGIEALDENELAALNAETALPLVRRCIARRLTESGRATAALLSQAAATPAAHADILRGMRDALKGQRQARPPEGWAKAPPAFAASADPAVRDLFRTLGGIFADPLALEATRRIVLDAQAAAPARGDALRALIEARAAGLRALCEQTLADPALTTTAASGLALEADPAIADAILRQYPATAAGDRAALLGILISRHAWAARMLDAVAAGKVPRKDLSAFHARQIRSYNDPALTERVTKLWGEVRDSSAEKPALILKWKTHLTPEVLAQADSAKGRAIFQNVCAACHVLNGEGGHIGPDITGGARANLDYLLQNIGDPSAVVARDYQLTTLTMKDGRALAGFVRAQNDRTVLLQTLTEAITLPTGDISKTEVAPISLMPKGLLEALGETEVRDLIRYLMAK